MSGLVLCSRMYSDLDKSLGVIRILLVDIIVLIYAGLGK